jgi:F-type H+-transporting ATPase subunit b
VKMDWKKSVLAGLTLVFALGVGFHLRETPVRAQESASASNHEGQSPEKKHEEVDEDEAYLHSDMVKRLGAKLGLNVEQSATAFTVFNFVLLAGFVGWMLVKILPKTLRNRTSMIQKSLADARTATEDARARLGSVEERLSKLDSEIAAMRVNAEQVSGAEEQRIKASVEDEKKKIIAAAEQEIVAATLHAQKQLQQHAAELAIEQAARKLVVSAETDRLLVQGFAQRLAGDESKKGQN